MLRLSRTAFFTRYLLALLVFNLAACSSMRPVSVENAMRGSPPRGVDYGSLVEVRTLQGESSTFRVTRINAQGLGGSDEFFRYEKMASLKVQETRKSDGNLASIVLGALGLAALVFVVASADSVAVCSPSPCEVP